MARSGTPLSAIAGISPKQQGCSSNGRALVSKTRVGSSSPPAPALGFRCVPQQQLPRRTIHPAEHTERCSLNGLMSNGRVQATQGRVTRQVTFAADAIAVILGYVGCAAGRSSGSTAPESMFPGGHTCGLLTYALPGLLLVVGLWTRYRIVNLPGFADFLIAVEAEMSKVSWPVAGNCSAPLVVVLLTINSGLHPCGYRHDMDKCFYQGHVPDLARRQRPPSGAR